MSVRKDPVTAQPARTETPRSSPDADRSSPVLTPSRLEDILDIAAATAPRGLSALFLRAALLLLGSGDTRARWKSGADRQERRLTLRPIRLRVESGHTGGPLSTRGCTSIGGHDDVPQHQVDILMRATTGQTIQGPRRSANVRNGKKTSGIKPLAWPSPVEVWGAAIVGGR
jgi:hypothetical protein